ncbi:MAG: DUF642 domain-containing protein [Fimbriimonadaceae bacterium]
MNKQKWYALAGLALAIPSSAFGQIANGGFETVALGGANGSGPGYWTFNNGNSNISDWSVGAISVDIVNSAYPVHSGVYALDLVGTPGPGEIRQTLALSSGQSYVVSFWAYSTGDPINMVLGTNAVGSGSSMYSITQGSWNQYTYAFTAASSSLDLIFASDATNTTNGNLFLDDISIEAVPEPASMVVLGGAALMSAIRRKRK